MKKHTILLLLSLLLGACNSSEEKPETLADTGFEELQFDLDSLPTLPHEGTILTGKRWKDQYGENLIVLTEDTLRAINEEQVLKDLYAYHFLIKEGGVQKSWQVYDFITAQEWEDVIVRHLPQSLAVTDIDKNGIGEVSFLYYLFAGTDVSPGKLKLILYEGDKKYALRGTNEIRLDATDSTSVIKSECKIDPNFEAAPPAFLEFAVERWEKFKVLE